jgi:hypothetical protein
MSGNTSPAFASSATPAEGKTLQPCISLGAKGQPRFNAAKSLRTELAIFQRLDPLDHDDVGERP